VQPQKYYDIFQYSKTYFKRYLVWIQNRFRKNEFVTYFLIMYGLIVEFEDKKIIFSTIFSLQILRYSVIIIAPAIKLYVMY
jgi:hypothetical protein